MEHRSDVLDVQVQVYVRADQMGTFAEPGQGRRVHFVTGLLEQPRDPLVAPAPVPAPVTADWRQENQRYLAGAIAVVRAALERFVAAQENPSATEAVPASESPEPGGGSWRVGELVEAFGLTPFERDVVLLCAGMELDPALTALVQRLRPAGRHDAVTFSLTRLEN